jgi:hypothetical protein
MGQVVKGPWKNPSAKEKLEREITVLRELIEAYRAEQAQKRAAHEYAPPSPSQLASLVIQLPPSTIRSKIPGPNTIP